MTETAMDRLDPWPARHTFIDLRFPDAHLLPEEVS